MWQSAIKSVRWPGRQESRIYQGREFLIDGAHNEASILACARWLRVELDARGHDRVAAIIGCSPGRDVSSVFEPLVPMLSAIHCVPADLNRTLAPDDVARALRTITSAPTTVYGDFDEAVNNTSHAGLTLIVGSLYLVGTALRHFGETPESLKVLT
jgi:dihydrofolate synthase/folylpolyglutamate synthase